MNIEVSGRRWSDIAGSLAEGAKLLREYAQTIPADNVRDVYETDADRVEDLCAAICNEIGMEYPG